MSKGSFRKPLVKKSGGAGSGGGKPNTIVKPGAIQKPGAKRAGPGPARPIIKARGNMIAKPGVTKPGVGGGTKPAAKVSSDPNEPVRLNKLMSERGLCSRREADDLIDKGLVMVDGEIVRTQGVKFLPSVKIEVMGRGQELLDDKVTILINKPKGYVSSQPEDGYRSAVDLVTAANQEPGDLRRYSSRMLHGLAPAGRLDIDSQGLLVMTQDGVVAKKLIGDNSDVEKEYIVRVIGSLSRDDMKRLNDGSLVIEGRRLRPALVEWINEDQLRFVLKEGMKRQIRKMCEAVGLKVIGLKRVRIGQITLGKLPEGKWRLLRKGEEF